MSSPRPDTRSERAAWEYADGPEVGREVPITSPPREEEAPGVLRSQPREDGRDWPRDPAATQTEEREVRAADPELTPELNERLTLELREVVGADRVRVPKDRPHTARGERPEPRTALAYLNQHRFQFVRFLAIALTFGAIISLITNDWWFLVLAAGVHALGTMTVTLTAIRMTTITEHPSAELGAALTEAGISSPDEYFSRMVDEFRRAPERGAGEVISPGHNERTTPAGVDTPEAGAEESSAMTPSAEPSRPGGERAAPDVLIWTTIVALLGLSIAIPPLMGGGWMWLLTAVMLPLIAGWVVVQWLFRARGDRIELQGPRALIAIAVCTTLGVAGFCVVVAFAFRH